MAKRTKLSRTELSEEPSPEDEKELEGCYGSLAVRAACPTGRGQLVKRTDDRRAD
jgi:hypothetical protein